MRAIWSARAWLIPGTRGLDDGPFPLQLRVVDVQVEAAALQGFGQLAGVVGGQEHEWDLTRVDGAELGDGHLVLGQDLEQQRLGLELDPVDLVDQQHHRLGGLDRLEERSCEEELLGEDVVLELLPGLPRVRLDAQQLLLVVPLVEGLGLVQSLVALQPDQAAAREPGHGLRQLGLAGAGRPLDQDRLGQAVGQVDDPGDPVVGQVVHPGKARAHGVDRLEAGAPASGNPEVISRSARSMGVLSWIMYVPGLFL